MRGIRHRWVQMDTDQKRPPPSFICVNLYSSVANYSLFIDQPLGGTWSWWAAALGTGDRSPGGISAVRVAAAGLRSSRGAAATPARQRTPPPRAAAPSQGPASAS